ncbi:hypothetical protein KA005_34430, partial [bacterium]|nr:hypothetical protein [bacterium]
VRLSVIDDEIAEDELHLLRIVPLAWLKDDFETKFENIPTEFGPVTIIFKLVEHGKTLQLNYVPKFRHKPKRVVLHVPPIEGLNRVTINDCKVKARPGDVICIPDGVLKVI